MIEEKLQKNEHELTPTILKSMGAEAHTALHLYKVPVEPNSNITKILSDRIRI